MAKRTKKRRTAFYVDMEPANMLVDGIDKLCNEDIVEIADRAYKAGMKIPMEQMKEWFEYIHRRTGRTVEAWHDGETRPLSKDYIIFQYGYDRRKSFTPIFFEYGTPRIKPEFVMYFAVKNHLGLLEEIFAETMSAEVQKKVKEAAPK